MRFTEIKPIEVINGKVVFNLDSDAANADWIRSLRLLLKGKIKELQKRFNTPMFCQDKFVPDDKHDSKGRG